MNNVLNTKFGKARINKNGYYMVSTCKYGSRLLHRLIFEDFYKFEIPDGFVVHHKDGNKLNNCILNLQLLSNIEHARLHGNQKFIKYARILKGSDNVFIIRMNGKTIKSSTNPSKLMEWFSKEYPTEILQLKINLGEDFLNRNEAFRNRLELFEKKDFKSNNIFTQLLYEQYLK